MTEPATIKSLVGSMVLTRILQIPLFIGALLAIYVEGATAYVNTKKAIEATAIADNASLKQGSEGVLAEQNARNALQVARNAAERQLAEAAKSEAEAKKSTAEAVTARNTARNAQLKARADAETIKAEAELRKQKTIVTVETARNAALRQKAEADKIEAQLSVKKQAAAIVKRQIDLTDCSKPYRGSGNMGDDFVDSYTRRIYCR